MEQTIISQGQKTSDLPRLAMKLSCYTHKDVPQDHEFIAAVLENTLPGVSHGMHIQALITSQEPAAVTALVERAVRMDPDYNPTDFSAWYQVSLEPKTLKDPSGGKDFDLTRPDHVNELVRRLNDPQGVESAYVLRPGPPPMPVPNPSANPRDANETYHDAAPGGIDASYAWGRPGGDGAGIGFVDMEQGWDLNHEDLPKPPITLISGTNTAYFFHGTSVLGEVLMVDNTIGGVGIAPNCTGRVISQYQPGGYNTAAAIIGAIADMAFGDVLLLEAQENDPVSGTYYWPVEIVDGTYEAIRLATALGIVVIEAGCNGAYNLDNYTNINGLNIFNRSSAGFRDSGAFMVGAGSSTVPHTRLSFSNYGSRIDFYGWGENVDTTTTDSTGTDNTLYTGTFNGTSSASPIVTGAAIIIQGIAQASVGYRFAPLELRLILAINGTASSTPSTDLIGVMPNLRAIITGTFVNLAPNFYLRDYVGDNGDVPRSGLLSLSPDIIVRQSPVSNPQETFGQGSGTENNDFLSQDVLVDRNNAIYVRLRNSGGSDATDVSVSVYYSQPATLPTPNLWTLIGTVTLPSVPTGNILTVSNELVWPAAAVPGLGHYCFIAVAGNAEDPAPGLADFQTLDNYETFIENNNKVAWRNFNVIPAPPSLGPGAPHHFPILIPGAFDIARVFTVEALGNLPRGSAVELQIPLTLARQLRLKLQDSQVKEKLAILPLHPFAQSTIGTGVLPPGSLAECNLLVSVPEQTYTQPGVYEFALRQLYQDREVGRVTWHFGQPASLKHCHCREDCCC